MMADEEERMSIKSFGSRSTGYSVKVCFFSVNLVFKEELNLMLK